MIGLRVVGKTEDGKLVVGNVFEICSTTGLPLADAVFKLGKHNMVPDMLEFSRKAYIDGWNKSTILARINDAFRDAT